MRARLILGLGLVALAVLLWALGRWLSPWFTAVICAGIALVFAELWRRRGRALAELLRDPLGLRHGFEQNLTRLRHRLREGEEGLRERDAEIAQRRQITNAIPDGLFLLDPEHRIVWCNRAALEMHRLDAFRDMGRPIGQLIRAPEVLAYLHDPSLPDPIVQLQGRTYAFHIEPSENGDQLLLTRDVTERERLDRMRRDFVSNVSHELRTPLTVVGGLVESLLELPLKEDERQRYLEMIATQAANMRRLVEDLLTLARLENDQVPLETQRVALEALARDALRDAEALSAGSHQFTSSLTSVEVMGSAQELASAIGNLLSNAVRYTPQGGTVRLVLRTDDTSREAIVEVIDSGIGIAAEHIPRLTERFYRVDRSRSRDTGGTGLGLAIVKHIMQRHRGRLEIESVLGHGSTFRLVLPLAS